MRQGVMSQTGKNSIPIVYVAFDKRTGRILHRHIRFDVQRDAYVDMPADDILKLLSHDTAVIEALTDHDIANLDVIRAPADVGGEVRVDLAKRTVEPIPRLVLKAEKTEIEGDGKDSSRIDIEVRGADDKRVAGAGGTVKVTTTRGRLSTRAGLVEIADGKATITLTSVPETVSMVQVSASSADGAYAGGDIQVEFI
jgi:hypothetical protein